MKTPFADIMRRFRVLSNLANEEAEAHSRVASRGTGVIDMASVDAREMFFEPSPCDKALEAFLKELPSTSVIALTGLMYAGRDHENDVLDYIDYLRGPFPTREDMARAISDKSPRMDYIDAGIERLGKVTLEQFHAQVEAKYGEPKKRERT